MKRGLPGVKAPAQAARDRRPQQQGHQGADQGLPHAPRRSSPSPRRRSRSTARRSGSRPSSGQRVFVLWRSYGNRSADERRTVIAHELVHAALVKRSGGRVPAWLSEGIAMYASGDKRAGDAGALLSGGAAAGHVQAGRGRARAVADDAREADVAGPHVGGPARVRVLVRVGRRVRDRRQVRARRRCCASTPAFNSEKIKGRPGRKLSDKVVRKALKTSLKSLEDDVDAYARARSSHVRPSLLGRDARAARSRDDPPPSGAPRRGAGAGGGGRARRALVPAARAGGARARGRRAAGSSGSRAAASTSCGSSPTTSTCSCTCA